MRARPLRPLLAAFLVVLAGWPAPAEAHLDLISPPSRYGRSVLKEPPCGMAGGTRSDNVTVLEPGTTIEVVWDEYIDHPGHYRIAFDPDGDDDFVDPATMTEEHSNDAVLLDGIADRDVTPGDSEYRVTVTLPDVECETCTLQVIQVMYDKPPYTIPGNDIYYQCADLVLRRAATTDAGATDAGTGGVDGGGATVDAGGDTGSAGGSDGGCAVSSGRRPPCPLVFVAGLGAVLVARRRRRPWSAPSPSTPVCARA